MSIIHTKDQRGVEAIQGGIDRGVTHLVVTTYAVVGEAYRYRRLAQGICHTMHRGFQVSINVATVRTTCLDNSSKQAMEKQAESV